MVGIWAGVEGVRDPTHSTRRIALIANPPTDYPLHVAHLLFMLGMFLSTPGFLVEDSAPPIGNNEDLEVRVLKGPKGTFKR